MSLATTDPHAVHLLWTGGWDSTFRLLDLTINHGRIVQPYYIINPKRVSFPLELETQAKIRQLVYASFPDTRHLILPTFLQDVDELPPMPDLRQHFVALETKYDVGSQYEWLARFAHAFQQQGDRPCLELSLTREGKVRKLLAGSTVPVTHGGLTTYQLAADPQDADFVLFRHLTFPLFNTTKPEMGELAARGGFRPLLDATWFCFTPVAARIPCGKCAACRALLECGYTERMHLLSHLRYWVYRHTRWVPNVKGKLKDEIKKYPTLHHTLKRIVRRDEGKRRKQARSIIHPT